MLHFIVKTVILYGVKSLYGFHKMVLNPAMHSDRFDEASFWMLVIEIMLEPKQALALLAIDVQFFRFRLRV